MNLKLSISLAALITGVLGTVLNKVDRRNTAGETGEDVVDAVLDEVDNKCLLDYKPGMRKFMELSAFASTQNGAQTISDGTGGFGVDTATFQKT